ncbi:MAG: DNA polymerase I [Actinomycetota bacterium]
MGRRLFLLDGHSLSYRAFYALPTTLATSTGQITNAVYGFTAMLIKLLAEERPDLLAAAFDRGAPTVRLEKYADYKAGRPEAPDEFRQQLGLIEEVLGTLAVPIVSVEGHEADDAIATLAVRAADLGIDVTIVTADRDFFQLVRPGITVMFNRKGISDIVRYDAAGVEERFGVPPAKYLDFVALKGDASDNIPGVPGVGEKTAAKLVREFGSVEDLVARRDEVPGKLGESIAASVEDLARNKDLARLETDLELDVGPEDCAVGSWDMAEVKRLFTSLEFRTLYERLEEVAGGGGGEPAVSAEIREGTLEEVRAIVAAGDAAIRLHVEDGTLRGVAAAGPDGAGVYAPAGDLAAIGDLIADPAVAKRAHDAKDLAMAVLALGGRLGGVAFDTMLAAYLVDPAAGAYDLGALSTGYLGSDAVAAASAAAEGELFAEPWRRPAAEAAATALLVPPLAERIDRAGLGSLLADVELPLSGVLGAMQAAGIALDVPYLEDMASDVRGRMDALRAEVFRHAGEEFNLNSPPQLRAILYEKLGLSPGKRTPKGQLSTDASVLEKLRDAHPIVDALLSWRELDKLHSTYLDALPRQVDPRDGRVHTTFNQTGAATGRISSSDPNLQNIPVRTELGRNIRRAFVPGAGDQLLLCADYSQIELRILAHLSGDEGLRAAFAGDVDIHTATAARVFGLPEAQVDPALRNRAKMVNYGLAYGMNAYGLATRLDIPPDEAQEIKDAYFASFPRIAEYLDRQVARAAAEGFTETLLGRRRYIPELQASNPRVRDLGRRMALNAPIQGSAADVFKLGMLRVARAIEAEASPCRMLLTVHDELVFEVAAGAVEAVGALAKREMEAAADLEVALRADLGWGPNWAEAAPEGH